MAEAPRRPVLIGMNNPLSSSPSHALHPDPPRCTGWNIWNMLAISALASEPPEIVTQADYIRAFERRNLINSRVWSATYASGMSGRILDTLTSGPVTVLGQTTAKCLKFKRHDWLETFRVQHTPEVELDVTIIPHPSGRCREYNDVGMRVAVGQHLLELYRAYAGQATLKSA